MNQALATVQYKPTELDTNALGSVLVKSGFFQDTKDVAQAIVKVLAGRELGFGPIASMQGVYIVKGRVTLSANLVGAAIQRSGKYSYRVKELTNDRCTIVFRATNDNSTFESTFTIQDAQQAGLASGNYKTFPRNMLFARALTNGARWFCPEVFNGPIYTPDELGAHVDGEGHVIEVSGGHLTDTTTGEVIEERPAKIAPAESTIYTEAEDDKRLDLMEWWKSACQRADELGISYKQLPDDADNAKVERWTQALISKINEVEQQGDTAA